MQNQQIEKEKTHTLVFKLEDWQCLALAYIGIQRTSTPLRGDDQLTLCGLLLEKFEAFLEPVEGDVQGTSYKKPDEIDGDMLITIPAGIYRMLLELKLGIPWQVEARQSGLRFSEIVEAAKEADKPKAKPRKKCTSKLKEVPKE